MILYNKDHIEIGYITSGCYSPILKKSIAIAYINKISKMSDTIYVKVRDNFEEIKFKRNSANTPLLISKNKPNFLLIKIFK